MGYRENHAVHKDGILPGIDYRIMTGAGIFLSFGRLIQPLELSHDSLLIVAKGPGEPETKRQPCIQVQAVRVFMVAA
jgi:hypothetical protein